MIMALKVLYVQFTACEISELTSNSHIIIRSEANDENLASNAKNLLLRHAGSKAPEGSL